MKFYNRSNRIHYVFWIMIAIGCAGMSLYFFFMTYLLSTAFVDYIYLEFLALGAITFGIGGFLFNFVANHYVMLDKIEAIQDRVKWK